MDDLRLVVPIPSVWDRLSQVEERLFEASTSEDPYLTKIAQHLLSAGGKRFRPLLCQLGAEFGAPNDRRPVEAGVAVELIHVGSLYHDDVIDEADLRRGATSVNANWSNTVAILAGDFLMARASEVASTYLNAESVQLLARTYAQLVEGQTLELQMVADLDHGLDDYFRVIGGKTATLIRTSARLGAVAADASSEAVEAVSTWAWELGMVFQIADDALDLLASEDLLGKPAGSDIREGTFTMPLLLAAAGPSGDRIRRLLDRPRPYPEEAVQEIMAIVRDGGHAEAALAAAGERLAVAQRASKVLPDVEAKEVLEVLGRYLVERVEELRVG